MPEISRHRLIANSAPPGVEQLSYAAQARAKFEPAPADDIQLIRKKALARRLGVDPSTLMRWVRAKTFPPPIKPSATVVAWRVVTVVEHLKNLEG